MKASRILSLFSLVLLVAALFGPGAAPVLAGGGTGVIYTVNSPQNAGDSNLGDGVCLTANGVCTLRAAIQEANFDALFNTIRFDLPGAGPTYQIMPNSPLPAITQPIAIDGTTQPGCSVPCVVLNGSLAGVDQNGLNMMAGPSTIKGLIIIFFDNYGIFLDADTIYVQSNYIGAWPLDNYARPNGGGISILSSYNVIGGTTAAERNVISGNSYDGIVLGDGGGPIYSNVIKGNYVGTTVSGTGALGNGANGILVWDEANSTTIGGIYAGEGNVVSGNYGSGIYVSGNNTVIRGNFIGTRPGGAGSIPNSVDGIVVLDNVLGIAIGGGGAGGQNWIAHNDRNGIALAGILPVQASIRRNKIFSNGWMGIDLGADFMTANDALDADSGPNGLQNYPIIVAARSSTQDVIIKLYSLPSSVFKIEFFSSPAGTCDSSGYGEGRSYLGLKSVTTDGAGYVRVRFVSTTAFAAGSVITTTATDSAGNTSEFSKCKTAQ